MSSIPEESPLNPEKERDQALDKVLRPHTWDEYIGQNAIKENVRILLTAAKQRGHAPEHLLFYGPPGLGKTTLAHLIARELGAQIRVTSGPAIERVGDMAAIITNLNPGDILFIDEIHRINKTVEEVLYPALETGTLDIILGKGPSARTIQLDLPPFTLIAATTRIALLSSPLRSRFSGGTFRLEFYTEEEIREIIKRSAAILGAELDDGAQADIARRSRRTPRTANYLLKRCRDYAQVHQLPLTQTATEQAFALLDVDEQGLTAADRALLRALIEKYRGGPVGLTTLGAALAEEPATIEEVYEPYLMQIGLLERTPRGRVATRNTYLHLGMQVPEESQEKLL